MLFNVNGNGEISFVSKLEEDKKTETNSKFSAKALFQTRDKMGVSDVADTVLNTTHQNQVKILAICSPNCVQIWKGRDRKMVFCRVRHKKC